MLAADIPVKFVIPFANDPDVGTYRVVPVTPPVEVGAASLEKGFTEVNMTPVSAGGVPPFGQDFNGLLYQDTAWARWLAAGGPVAYDSTFQTAIGGYPAGAFVQSVAAAGRWFLSTTDNNVTDPDAGGAGWREMHVALGVTAAAGTADTITAAASPAWASYSTDTIVYLRVTATNTGAVTVNVNGLGAKSVRDAGNAVLAAGAWKAGDIIMLVYDGTVFRWQTAQPIAGFIKSLPVGSILGTSRFPAYNVGSGLNETYTANDIATFVILGSDMFFFGMMG